MKKLWCLILAVGCGSGGGAADAPAVPLPRGVATFTHSPIALGELSRIVALGNLNPPGHTIPTDHIYFYMWYYDDGPVPDPNRKHTVYAPAGGTVVSILQPGGDFKVVVQCTNTFYYYLDHVLPTVQVGAVLTAGQAIGTSGGPYAIDLGAYDTTTTLPGFIDPNRYHPQTRQAVSPLAHYEEPLRSTLRAKVVRSGTDKDGRIDFDVPGRLVGNWFLDGVPPAESDWPENWTKQLAFVRDVADPAIVRVSIGGTLAMSGAWAADPADPDPAHVQKGQTIVLRLYNRRGLLEAPDYTTLHGVLLVEMLEDRKIKVEAFPTNAFFVPAFSPEAKIYVR